MGFGALLILGALFCVVVGTLGGLGLIEPDDTVQDRVGGAVGCALIAGVAGLLGGAHIAIAFAMRRLLPWARSAMQ